MNENTEERYLYVVYDDFNDELLLSHESFIEREFIEEHKDYHLLSA